MAAMTAQAGACDTVRYVCVRLVATGIVHAHGDGAACELAVPRSVHSCLGGVELVVHLIVVVGRAFGSGMATRWNTREFFTSRPSTQMTIGLVRPICLGPRGSSTCCSSKKN